MPIAGADFRGNNAFQACERPFLPVRTAPAQLHIRLVANDFRQPRREAGGVNQGAEMKKRTNKGILNDIFRQVVILRKRMRDPKRFGSMTAYQFTECIRIPASRLFNQFLLAHRLRTPALVGSRLITEA